MITSVLKKLLQISLIKKIVRILFFPIVLIAKCFRLISEKLISLSYKVDFFYEWSLAEKEVPNFFKHLINLYTWRDKPSNHMFTTAPSIARSFLKRGGRVLDICCGDGSTSYLFFSGVAAEVDAIDLNPVALKYARKTFAKENISFMKSDANEFLKTTKKQYNLVYFGSAFDYFSKLERHDLFKNIMLHLASDAFLVLKTPVWSEGSYSKSRKSQVDAKEDFISSKHQLIDELEQFFNQILCFEVEYENRVEIIAVCREPH